MMRLQTLMLASLSLAAFATATACDDKSKRADEPAAASAVAIGIAECAACGMVVHEQPAPRGQVVHRDGTRGHLCSVGELVQYLEAPSPHGKPVAVFVEALEGDFDPGSTDTKERPWIRAERAMYVVGIERERVMGKPALSYDKREQATAAATKGGGTVKTWAELRAAVLDAK